MESDPLLGQLILQLLLIALNAVFACAEIAVITMNDVKLARLAADGDRRAIRLAGLTRQPAKFLATIQVAITLSGFLGSAFAADNFSERLVALLVGAGVTLPVKTLDTAAVIVITLLLSYLTLVFGELVPKRLAMKNAEKLSLRLAAMLTFISRLFVPVVWLLTASTNGVLRLLRIDPDQQDETVTEEEIRMLIDAGSESGTIDAEEKTMLQNVFEFDDVTAGEIATHRTNVNMLWMDDSDEAWETLIHDTRHSYYPICADTGDNVIGILDAKSYFRLDDRSRASIMDSAVQKPHFVPESVKADVLFADMKKRRNRFAIVLDEYGGVSGIVTMNDLIEEIVGDLTEEGDEEPCVIERLDSGAWRMNGAVPLDDVSDALQVPIPDEDVETLGGLVFSTLSTVPPDGTRFTCTVGELQIEVLRLEKHRIAEALVSRIADARRDDAV